MNNWWQCLLYRASASRLEARTLSARIFVGGSQSAAVARGARARRKYERRVSRLMNLDTIVGIFSLWNMLSVSAMNALNPYYFIKNAICIFFYKMYFL